MNQLQDLAKQLLALTLTELDHLLELLDKTEVVTIHDRCVVDDIQKHLDALSEKKGAPSNE